MPEGGHAEGHHRRLGACLPRLGPHDPSIAPAARRGFRASQPAGKGTRLTLGAAPARHLITCRLNWSEERMDFTLLSRWQPQLLALLRIVTGLLFLEHATQKFFAFPVPFPMPGPLPPLLIAAGVIELVAGLLVTIGLLTRLAAFVASGEMAVAYFMMHFPKRFWPAQNM